MVWALLRALLDAICLIWVVGSSVAITLKPWRHFDPADRWLAWALLIGWPLIVVAMSIELLVEFRLDRRDDRRARALRGGEPRGDRDAV